MVEEMRTSEISNSEKSGYYVINLFIHGSNDLSFCLSYKTSI